MKITILSAGLTGLILGYLLGQEGVEFDIFEKEECDGLTRSLQGDASSFDTGHIFETSSSETYPLRGSAVDRMLHVAVRVM